MDIPVDPVVYCIHPPKTSITIEKQAFEDAPPVKSGDFPASVIVYWRVIIVIHILNLHRIILGHLSSVRFLQKLSSQQ